MTSPSQIQLLETAKSNFHTNFVEFIDELIELFPKEKDLIMIRLFVKDCIPVETILNSFITHVLPRKELVENRDDSFFTTNSVFEIIDKVNPNRFKMLWKSSSLDQEDRDIIWQWFDTFIALVEMYQKIKLDQQ